MEETGDKNRVPWLCVAKRPHVFCHTTPALPVARQFSGPSPGHSRYLLSQGGCGFLWPTSRNPQRWRPHLLGALSQSCISLLGGSASYSLMVNEVNTYQRLSWVRPKSVQPRILWQAATSSGYPVRSMETRLQQCFPRALPSSNTAQFICSPSWRWYVCFFRPWRIPPSHFC